MTSKVNKTKRPYQDSSSVPGGLISESFKSKKAFHKNPKKGRFESEDENFRSSVTSHCYNSSDMASNCNWNKRSQDKLEQTPPSSSSGRKVNSRLSRRNKDGFLSPISHLPLTPKQGTSKATSHVGDSLESPSSESPTAKHDWFLSQDPSREIIWDYRPLSPLKKSTIGHDREDLMTNLCKTWKKDGKESSPLGSDALLKQWTKPKGTPVKTTQTTRPSRFRETAESLKPSDTRQAVDRFTKELQRINKMILQSKPPEESKETKNETPPKIQPQIVTKKESPKKKPLIIVKDAKTFNNSKIQLLDESLDIFDSEILAPDSCEELWGDVDDSFDQQLSQVELCADARTTQLTIIPSTLSSEEEEKDLATFKDIVNISGKTQKRKTSITLSEVNLTSVVGKTSLVPDENVPNRETKSKLSSQTSCVNEDKEKKTKEPEPMLIDDFSDLFNDDNFDLTQEELEIINPKTADVVIPPPPEEESCSQKRRATAADIARKREEALKRRQSKMMTKSSSFACSNTKKPFIRTFTEEQSSSQKRRATAADIARKREEALKLRQTKMKKSSSFTCTNTKKPFIRTFSGNAR